MSPYRIECMRFEPDAPYPELVKTLPHVAFEVDDLEQELEGKNVIIAPNNPSPGVTVEFIEHNGAPMSFYRSTRLNWRAPDQTMEPNTARADYELVRSSAR
jgi:hypothetical protein